MGPRDNGGRLLILWDLLISFCLILFVITNILTGVEKRGKLSGTGSGGKTRIPFLGATRSLVSTRFYLCFCAVNLGKSKSGGARGAPPACVHERAHMNEYR